MIKDHMLHITHILESIELIEEFIKGCSKNSIFEDRMRYYAILRNLQTLAESTQHLPQNLKNKHIEIPWKDISGFRNILVHEYLEGFDEDIIWSILAKELPVIKAVMKQLCEKK